MLDDKLAAQVDEKGAGDMVWQGEGEGLAQDHIFDVQSIINTPALEQESSLVKQQLDKWREVIFKTTNDVEEVIVEYSRRRGDISKRVDNQFKQLQKDIEHVLGPLENMVTSLDTKYDEVPETTEIKVRYNAINDTLGRFRYLKARILHHIGAVEQN